MRKVPGSYSAKRTPFHRVDARVKIFVLFALSAAVFTADLMLLIPISLGVLCLSFAAGLSVKAIGTALRPAVPIFAVVVAIHAFLGNAGPSGTLFSPAGFYLGLTLTARFSLLIIASTIFTRTSSPLEVTAALEVLLSPLKVLRLPVNDLALMLSLALRSFLLLLEELQQLAEARKARGGELSSVTITRRIRQVPLTAVALIGNGITRADGTAEALIARGYTPGGTRTRLRPPQLNLCDCCAALLGAALLAVAFVGRGA